MKPTAHELRELSGAFFYDEQGRVENIVSIHIMRAQVAHFSSDFGLFAAKHVSASSCWCKPMLTTEDEYGLEIWLHESEC